MHLLLFTTAMYTLSCDSLSVDVAAISVVLISIITLGAGLFIGYIVTYCVMKKRAMTQKEEGKVVVKASREAHGPLYAHAHIPRSKFPKERFKIGDNVAYGN